MSGGGLTFSKRGKLLMIFVIVVFIILSILSFIKAVPFDNVFTSILLIVLSLVLLIMAFILLVFMLTTK